MNPAAAERSSPAGENAPAPATIAIVVSYNSAPHLGPCLASLEAQHGVSPCIYLIDNASSDKSVELVRREFPRVRVLENARNVGFARANNQVLEQETTEFYALVNPDAVVHPDAMRTCVDYLKRDPKAGVAATRLVFPDGTLQRSCHSFLGLRNLLGETLGIHRLIPGLRSFASFHLPWFDYDRAGEVDWIVGAFLVIRGEVVRTVGGFDPEFFMYGEEMDWCRRIHRAGWKVVYLPAPPVMHVGGASSAPVAGPMFVENLKGRVRFLQKHRGPFVAAAARGVIALSVLLRYAWREARALGLSLVGRRAEASLRTEQIMFRSAIRWVLLGLPLSPQGTDGL